MSGIKIDQLMKDEIIKQYMNSVRGRAKLAQSMVQPLRAIYDVHRCALCGAPCGYDHGSAAECEISEVIDS